MTMTVRQLNNEDDNSIVDDESASMSKSCLMLRAPPCFVKYSSDQPYWETIDNPGDEDYQAAIDTTINGRCLADIRLDENVIQLCRAWV